MNEAFLTRRGGSGAGGLNFHVVGGTTQPKNPKENTIWVNTATPIKSYALQAETPARVSNNKNLIVFPFYHTTQTGEGITWTDNGDGTVKANGTAVGGPLFRLSAFDDNGSYMWLAAGTYTLSGCPVGGSASTYLMELFILNPITKENESVAIDYGEGATFTLAFACKARVNLNVINGATVNAIVFKPQLEKGSAATAFVKGDATGQIWVKTADASDMAFNALKKNTLQVYPADLAQYAAGAWENKEGGIYQSGAWAEFVSELVLFDNGSVVDWTKYIRNSGNDSCTIGSTIVCTRNSGTSLSYTGAVAYTVNPIPLAGYSKLNVRFKSVKGLSSYIGVCNSSASNKDQPSTWAASLECKVATYSSGGTATLDISGCSGQSLSVVFGEQYIKNETGSSCEVDKVWLE